MMDGTQSGGAAEFGRGPVVVGLMIAGVGLIRVIAMHAPRPGRLPGDIVIEGKDGRFSFPVMTCVVISIILSPAAWIFRALTR